MNPTFRIIYHAQRYQTNHLNRTALATAFAFHLATRFPDLEAAHLKSHDTFKHVTTWL